ncbi:MAG: ATP-binding protein [bacterium]
MYMSKIGKTFAGILGWHHRPHKINKLREQVEVLVAGHHLPACPPGPTETDDVEAIELGIRRIVHAFHERLSAVEQANEVLQRQLVEADRLKGVGLMTGGIAHDFGNIMCVVAGSAQVAQQTLQNTEQTAELLRTIAAAAQHGAELTQQVMAQASGQQAVRGVVNISAAISQIAQLLRASVGSSNTMQLQLDENVSVAEADVTQIRQIVLNLVLNAADALANPGTITITTSKRAFSQEELHGLCPQEHAVPGRYACIEVSDTGCGMAEETRKHLFDDFYTTKVIGRGLGLSVVLSVVRSHDGLVGVVASAPDKGTTFRVLIPSKAAAHRAARGISK